MVSILGSSYIKHFCHHRSSIGQCYLRAYIIMGAGGGVYTRLFAVFGSNVEPEVTKGEPEGSQGRKLDLDESRNRLETCGNKLEFTSWNPQKQIGFACLSLLPTLIMQMYYCRRTWHPLGSCTYSWLKTWRSWRRRSGGSWSLGAASCQQGKPVDQ